METIPTQFRVSLDPAANPKAVAQTDRARFTLLTSRLIRMEWSPTGRFEDRASQAFWFRDQPAPEFSVQHSTDELLIETAYLRLHYVPDAPFTGETLWIELKQVLPETPKATTWHFGDPDPGNLCGTARTLDGVDGPTPLSLGLVSRSGWALVDDSNSLVFNEVGWLEPRNAPAGQLDLHFFGYGHDYLGCLRDFNLVSGSVPMIPRFVLGNWWSRYWEYSQDELEHLMDDFQAHDVPLSVCIIDMDWHITQTGNRSTGWTGYTWNRKLFPDPEGLLRALHAKGLKVALNLHPAEGIHPHEAMYAEMRQAVGGTPEGEPVEFDITNPRFVEAYFSILHHPQEARGVDFWWMDWQQGARTRLSGLDPLWWLNHLHFMDLGRDGKRRSFIFSRWGGLGNHRYPIGFSGDSIVSWASLAFQPYFTATASNVNYGWWSHDIGGHMGGIEDAELYTRWVQLGVFQPVLRLHSTKNPYHERRPWGFDAETFVAARAAMQLRHALIPYLYSLAWRYHRESIPPILPMYYAHSEREEAYACPNQYMFGEALVFAPFITPENENTRLSRAVAWLPEGDWFNFFTGEYAAGGWQAIYGTRRDIPVFAKAGAIVPTGPMAGWDNVETPGHLIVHVFPGADGRFDLYEDEGNTMSYLDGAYAITPLRQDWAEESATLTIGPAEGAANLLPPMRQVDLHFRGFASPDAVNARLNGAPMDVIGRYDSATSTFIITGLSLQPGDHLDVTLKRAAGLANRADNRLAACQRLIKHFRMESWVKSVLAQNLPAVLNEPAHLGRYLAQLAPAHFRALMETITGAGIERTNSTGADLIVVWNNHADEHVTHEAAAARLVNWHRYKFSDRYPWSDGPLPRFRAYGVAEDFGEGNPWTVQLNYYGVGMVKEQRS